MRMETPGKICIAYVDDDPDDIELFMTAARELQHDLTVRNFSSGEGLVNYLNTTDERPVHIFIDINMPQMNGHECAAAVRSHEQHKNANIVMFSTTFSPWDVERFKECKYNYLEKPAEFSVLKTSLKQIVSRPLDTTTTTTS